MQLMKTTMAAAAILASLMLSGCPASMSGSAYSRDQARQAQDVRMGYVESVRQIMIEGTRSGTGALAGAALGGVAGSNIGGGSGRIAGAVGGAVIGGLAGSAIEENVTRQPGLEITVRLDNGRMVAVTQGADEPFYPGDRVRLLTSQDGVARVAHDF